MPLEPGVVPLYQRGYAHLPDIDVWISSGGVRVLTPYGDKSFIYKDEAKELRAYSSILGCLIRKHFPGIVTMPSGHKEVAWSWRHYRYTDDPEGTSEFSLPNLQARLMSYFLTYFTMDQDVRQRDCVLVASRCAFRQIRDMHYEARVACVRNWYAEKRKIRMTKAKAREIFMEPWQYLQCPPQYVGQASPEVFRAMVRYWTSTGFKKKHDLGVLKRAALKGGTHTQGNVTLAYCIQKKKRETGVDPSLFDVWTDKCMVTDKEDGTKKWVSSCTEIRDKGYRDKYAKVNGKDVDPLTAPFDPEVAMLAGQGKKHSRLWIGDGSVDPLIIPSMRQVRRGRTSDMPQVETRPTVTSTAIDQIRAEVAAERRQREEAEANSRRMEEQIRQQKKMLTQQQQQMAKNEKMMEWMAQNMSAFMASQPSGVTLPDLGAPPFTFPT